MRRYSSESTVPKLLFGLLLLFLGASCSHQPRTEYLRGDTMGTFYTVQLWSDERKSIQELDTDIVTLLDQFESQLSNWRQESWINQFNQAPAGELVSIPDMAFEVVSMSLELAENSNGLLDPTAGPLIELWGFGTDRQEQVPSSGEIRKALEIVGYEKLRMDPVNRTITKEVSGVQLNVSAMAKGYAVDLLARELLAEGIEHFLINIGGEIRALGRRLDGQPWKVGVRQPVFQGRSGKTIQSVALHNQALATSGHAQRSFEKDGRYYSHILNPRTGYPVTAGIASVTIQAPSCAIADGLATLALIHDEAMEELLLLYDAKELFRIHWVTEDIAFNP